MSEEGAQGTVEGSTHALMGPEPAEPRVMIEHLSEASAHWSMQN